MAQIRIDPARSGLVIFDMINDLVRPATNPSRTQGTADSGVIDRCVEIIDGIRGAGMAVFYAGSAHRPDGGDYGRIITDANNDVIAWPNGPQLMGIPSAIEGTPGADVISELPPRAEDYIIPKHRWSAFAGTSLDASLRSLGIDTIVLAGVSTDLGILATAYAARDLGYHLVILRDGCYTNRPDAQDFCMERLFPRMARVVTVKEALQLIDEPRERKPTVL